MTTTQAGKILGVTSTTVWNLVKAGKLKDHARTKHGKSKHFIKLRGVDVLAFKKSYKKHYRNFVPIQAQSLLSNQSTNGNGFTARLESLKVSVDILTSKIDILMKMWS